MVANLIERCASAHSSALLIKHLLQPALTGAPEQEIVYRSHVRHSYRVFRERVGRLASGLAGLGVEAGHTVAVMDFDSHRYLECFFAVPMMGATLHTINVRLSPEQILHTINHARDDVILVNSEFLPILEKIWDRVEGVKSLVWIDEVGEKPATVLPLATDYEALLAGADPGYVFPNLDEDTRATTFYTTGTTGLPKGVYFSHRQLVLHTLALRNAITGRGHGRLNAGDVYMPATPMFHVHAWGLPYVATTLGLKQVYPGKYSPDVMLDLIARERVTFSHCVPTILQMLLAHPKSADGMLDGWKIIIGGAALPWALAKAAMERGIDVTAGYGMSETCSRWPICGLKTKPWNWIVSSRRASRRAVLFHSSTSGLSMRGCRTFPMTGSRRGRSWRGRRGSHRAICTIRRTRKSSSSADGCTPETSASSEPMAISRSPTASRMSSRPEVNGSPRSTSRI